MRKTYLASLLITLFGILSLPLNAAPANPAAAAAPSVQAESDRLDLNKADAMALQSQLSGIGKSKAEAIVAYREEHGDFASIDELLEIKGIGKALLDRNRDKLTVN
ncbi:helix-hairpin-helix domain-containing protein [Pseudomonas putida CSV86]|uniref:Helix-hairpin-helix domain-containing protein n=1 Tax=Pseudomonas bharatica CSV86 TaxID=1005395 RepID=L1LT88_9PSED|nr:MULTISPECIES: ComEA family DNA-binding protein [Pseudomonas]MDG9883159.1 helix-hairpin-helix domain-containing protein [Pseudomonas sp. GD04058]NNJ14381.1 helix-hairpin-helix domain-containing protein [Pseudomonas bharatica CSV86]